MVCQLNNILNKAAVWYFLLALLVLSD